jgi:hypothetical protein
MFLAPALSAAHCLLRRTRHEGLQDTRVSKDPPVSWLLSRGTYFVHPLDDHPPVALLCVGSFADVSPCGTSSEPHPNFFEACRCVVIDAACALYTSYDAELIDALSGIVNKADSVNGSLVPAARTHCGAATQQCAGTAHPARRVTRYY